MSCTIVGIAAALLLLVATLAMLFPYKLGFSVNSTELYRALWNQGSLSQPDVDLQLAEALNDRRIANASVVRWLTTCLRIAA